MPIADRDKRNQYNRAWLKHRRQAWLLENGPCRCCGSWERLEVDHIDPSEKNSHKVWSWKSSRRDVELAKCQPLCYVCHKKKTSEFRAATPITHGAPGGYHRGCRCELCHKWQKERMAKYHIEHPRRKGLF